jgi:flagellar motility protein MotE (MotC chaperone)
MDHDYIERLDLIRRYLMGRLTVDESTEFEEHFVDCSQCVDQLRTTENMILGFRVMASRQSQEEADYRSEKTHWYSARSISPQWLALAGSLLLLILVAGAFILNRSRLARIETDEAKSESSRLQQRLEEQRQSAESADSKHQETERELTERLTELQAELEDKREPGIASQNGSLQPQINIPIFVLNTMRGNAAQSGSVNAFTISRFSTSFVIVIPLEAELGYRDYRMTILDDHGQQMWKSSGLKPDGHNSLRVGLNSGFFHSGDYVLTVEGVSDGASTSVIARHRFHVK